MIADNDLALGRDRRPDLALADLGAVADPRHRGRLAGRRRPRRRPPDPRVRDQPVRASAARSSTRATTSSRSSARCELIARDEAAQPLRRDRGADVRRLRRRPVRQRRALRRDRARTSTCSSATRPARRTPRLSDAPAARVHRPPPQRILDRILWQSVHGADSEPPPPGPNAAGIDERGWRSPAPPPTRRRSRR